MIRTILFLILSTLSACSANWPHALNTAVPDVKLGHPLNIRVVVKDARVPSPLVAEEHAPKVVGEIRQLLGSPIAVTTKSGEPLATDIGNAICQGFELRSWTCESATTTFSGTVKEEIPFILNSGKPVDRILYVLISRYNAEISSDTVLQYDLDVTLWNGVGRFLTSTGQHGAATLETNTYLNPAENASEMVPAALKEILVAILSAKPMKNALTL